MNVFSSAPLEPVGEIDWVGGCCAACCAALHGVVLVVDAGVSGTPGDDGRMGGILSSQSSVGGRMGGCRRDGILSTES
jgi:hypothetical protein